MMPPLYLVSRILPPHIGGAAAGAFARGAARAGWDVTTWTLGVPSRYEGVFCEDPSLEGAQPGVTVMRTPAVGTRLFGAAVRMVACSRFEHPTWAWPVAGELARVAKRRPGVFCGVYPGRDNVLLAADASRRAGLPLWLDFRKAPARFRGLRQALAQADAITVATAGVEAALRACGSLPARVFLLPHGGAASPHAVPLRGEVDTVRFAVTGRFDGRRDLATLRDAVARLRKHVPTAGAALEVTAYGDATRATQRVFARADERFRFEGVQPHAALMRLFSEADALLLPLKADYPPEAMPDAACEALLCGVPVIAAAPDGALRGALLGGLGLVTPPGDIGALAEAMARFCLDAELRMSLRMHVLAARTRFHLETSTAAAGAQVLRHFFPAP